MTENSFSLDSFEGPLKVGVVGANGGIGSAFLAHLANYSQIENIFAFSRSGEAGREIDGSGKVHSIALDFLDEESLAEAVGAVKEVTDALDILIISTGILHDGDLQPEKSMRDLALANMEQVFAINTFGPALAIKHFSALIPKDRKSIIASLSARVGSISDNGLGGWTSYRASKSALNMVIRNAAIEVGRRYKKAAIVGLHPGTVDTGLSEPFQGNVPEGKLFTPEYSTAQMLSVINGLTAEDSGKAFDYKGEEIVP